MKRLITSLFGASIMPGWCEVVDYWLYQQDAVIKYKDGSYILAVKATNDMKGFNMSLLGGFKQQSKWWNYISNNRIEKVNVRDVMCFSRIIEYRKVKLYRKMLIDKLYVPSAKIFI